VAEAETKKATVFCCGFLLRARHDSNVQPPDP
jgi:hypothetical protein